MNATHMLHSARRILTAVAVTVVAATCLGSATTISAATDGHHRAGVTQATKEWKATVATTSRTKEW